MATQASWRTLLRAARAALTQRSGGAACVAASGIIALASTVSWAESLFDPAVRDQMFKHSDGRIAHVETEYNDIFINKRGGLLTLSTRYKGESFLESRVDLKDPDDMPVPYTQVMPAGLLYAEATKRILMLGLGAGSVSTYLARAMPDVQIDVVELDPGVIDAAKKYFGVEQTERVHIIAGDGRVYLNRHKEPYDLILLDAYRELGVPFHLLTKEFYTLVKERLAPNGAVASNIVGGTKLYASTLRTLREVFSTVDVYPVPEGSEEIQVVAVATPSPAPAAEALAARAAALQEQYRFRYTLPVVLKRRLATSSVVGGELLTDDFAPVGLYEVTPIRPRKR